MKTLFIVQIFALLFLFSAGSCPPNQITQDPSGNTTIKYEAKKFLYGCGSFFMPPAPDPFADPTKKNEIGAIAWTPSLQTGPGTGFGEIDTKERYITKVDLATKPNQQSWYQYQDPLNENSGFPGYEESQGGTQHPDWYYQAGLVCFGLVYRSVTDALYDPWQGSEPFNVDDLTNGLTLKQNSEADVGDLVFFNWDNAVAPEQFEHVGIIVEKIGGSGEIRNWKIVSSIGTIEIMEWGAKETRLGVWGTTANGGEYTYWNSNWEGWTFKIYRVPTN
ncbi:MAG: hypothetical protein KKA19_01470 [Candidatus Margulisbacteria bacterium]|nr:hypothetical protein [Candidatus Margulisiibacteriota bacterium]